MVDPVHVDGLKAFARDLKKVDKGVAKGIRVALNEAADVVVRDAKTKVPTRSGRAKRAIKAKSTSNKVRVAGGGGRVPYYPWLDYGGSVGPGGSVKRPFKSEGRYIYPSFRRNRDSMVDTMERSLVGVVESAGLGVDSG